MAYYEIPNESETILNGVILDNETMSINDGGTANDTVAKHGYINIYSGGTANNTTLTDNGFLYVHSSATANKVVIDSGTLEVYSGGTATEIEWTPCVGSVTVENGAHVEFSSKYTGVYYGSGGEVIESAATMDDRKLKDELQSMYVMSDGIANRTEVYFSGCQHVCAGGTVNSTWVRGYGNLLVSSGGTASDTTLSEYSSMAVFSGGAANNTVVNSGTFKLSGGVADGVTLNVGGNLIVDDGGKADKVKINASGCLTVSGGGSASVTTDWTPGVGRVVVYGGGQVTFAGEYTGVYYGDGDQVISSAAEMNDIELYANYYELYVMNGGKANYTTVDGGYMAVFSGGAADSTGVVSGGKIFVNNGGKAEHATIGKWGEVYVNSGGTANSTTVNLYGYFTVFGSADDVTVNNSGTVWVLDGGKATNATLNNRGDMAVSDATVDLTTVNSGGRLFIEETGKADHTTVNSSGSMVVSGSAENTTISGGEAHISSGGTMTETKVTTGETDRDWGYLTVWNGGTAIKTTVDPNGILEIRDGASADVVTVAAGGIVGIYESATATNITAVDGANLVLAVAPGTYAQGTYAGSAFEMKDGILSGYTARYDEGVLFVVSGGVATDITVAEGAQIRVDSDGVLDGITVTGGHLTVYEGGKVTGKMRFNDDDGVYRIWTYNGAIVDFDLTRTAPGDEVLVNNLAAINGYGQFTLTVDGTEKNGVYCLADGASGFNKTITVMNTDGEALGTLTVGGEAQVIDDVTYQLARDGSILTLTVSGAPDLTGDLNYDYTLGPGKFAKKVNVNEEGVLSVYGTAKKTAVNKNGAVYVYTGGLVEDITVNKGGFISVQGGKIRNAVVSAGEMDFQFGTVSGTVVEKDGRVTAYDELSNTAINDGGHVLDLGAAYDTTVNKGGEFTIKNSAADVTVKKGGMLTVSAGARITGKMTFEEEAFVVVENGATVVFDLQDAAAEADPLLNDLSIVKGSPSFLVTVTGEETEGTYNLAGGAAGFNSTITVRNIATGQSRYNVTVGDIVKVSDAFYTLGLNSDNILTLTVGGDFVDTDESLTDGMSSSGLVVVEGGKLIVEKGARADKTTVNEGGSCFVSSGGVATDTNVGYKGTIAVASGGTATGVDIAAGGIIAVDGGGSATEITAQEGALLMFSVAPGTEIKGTSNGSAFEIGDTVTGYTVQDYGNLLSVRNGGTAEKVTVTDQGRVDVDGGLANSVTVKNWGYLYVSEGGVADNTSVSDVGHIIVGNGGLASNTTIGADGDLYLVKGGRAEKTTVQYRGDIMIDEGGVVENTTIEGGGQVWINSGGIVKGLTICNGGEVIIDKGGKITGKMTFEDGAVVSASSSYVAIIDFDLAQTTAGAEEALVNNLSLIKGAPKYTLTVDGTQEYGKYKLADGAAGFSGTITVVNTSDEALGTISVGGDPKKIKRREYSVDVTDGSLWLTITPIIPENCPDLGWNDYVYDKKKSKEKPPQPELNPNKLNETVLNDKTTEILLDKEDTIDKDDKYFNFVGKGITKEGEERIDKTDFAKLTLEYGARVSFDLEATDAAKFTVWSLSSSTKGETTTYKQTSLQSTKLKKVTNGGVTTYTAQTKNLWLGPGEYYVSMESTSKNGGEAYYSVTVNEDKAAKNHTILYPDGDGGWNDYLYDKKTKTLNPSAFMLMETDFKVNGTSNIQMECEEPVAEGAPEVEGGWNNFVGFGDAKDFARIYPYYPADATFSVTATGASKFTVWSLTVKGTDSKTGNTLYTMKALKTVTLKKNATTGLYSAAINDLLLDRLSSTSDYYVGYYVSMQATNPKKDTCVYYNATVDNRAYWSADSGGNKYLYDKKKDPANYNPNLYTNSLDPGAEPKKVYVDYKDTVDGGFYPGEEYKSYSNFVGFGDEWDYAEISLSAPGTLSFTVDAYSEGLVEKASANLKFTVYSLTRVVKGEKVTWKQKTLLATQTITVDKKIGYVNGAEIKKTVTVKEATSDDVKYFVSVQSVGAKKGASVYYNVWATLTPIETAALSMPESSDSLGITDSLSLGQYTDADALADASASALAELDDKSAWQSLLA